MFTRKQILVTSAAILLTAAAVAAQTAGAGARFDGKRGERFKEFIASYLDLTEAQKELARSLFKEAQSKAAPLRASLKTGHEAMRDAVKANAPDIEIDRLAKAQGEAMGQLAAIHAKAMAEFYQALTPEQREKAGKLHDRVKEGLAQHFGRRR
jgi:Spy/CpxP family protein refolding chaperone